MIRGRNTLKAVAVAGLAVWLVKNAAPRDDAFVAKTATSAAPPPARPAQPERRDRRSWRRRAALTLVYTTVFFAGGAVVAGAGNELTQVDAGSTDAAVVTADGQDTVTTESTETTTTAATTTDAVDPAVAPEADPSDAAPPVTPDAGAAPSAAAPAVTTAPAHVDAQPARRPAAAERARAAAPTVSSPFPVVAFDPQAWLVGHPGTPAGDAAVTIAEQYLGIPYRWGGNAPSTGFDCSGLTQFVYAQLGVWLPHYAAAQFLAYPRVDPAQLEPGDLVFFEPKPDGPGHVAIYVGGDAIVEAPHTGATVRIGSLTGAATSLGFLGAVRPSASSASLPTLEPFALVVAASPPTNWLARAA